MPEWKGVWAQVPHSTCCESSIAVGQVLEGRNSGTVIVIPAPSGPDSSYLLWETGFLGDLFMFQMGRVTFWRSPAFSVDYTKKEPRWPLLLPQVTRGDESEPWRTSPVLNKWETGHMFCTKSCSAYYLLVQSLVLSPHDQSNLLSASHHGRTNDPCSPSFIRRDVAAMSRPESQVEYL